MKHITFFTLSVLLISGAASADGAQVKEQRTIPKLYRGDWALSVQKCAPGPADSGNLRIASRTILSFESRINVKRVRINEQDSIDFTSTVHHGGGVFGDQSRLTLLDGGTRLAVGDGEEREFYNRCTQ